jgi:hypothetical protein
MQTLRTPESPPTFRDKHLHVDLSQLCRASLTPNMTAYTKTRTANGSRHSRLVNRRAKSHCRNRARHKSTRRAG